MKHHLFSLTLLSISFLLSGCGNTTPVSAHKYAVVAPNHVQVLYQEPTRPYELLALVNHSNAIWPAPVSGDIGALRESAAKLGADAIIITTGNGPTLFHEASASAKAIKWTK